MTPPDDAAKSGQTHSKNQEGRSSKERVGEPHAALSASYAVRSPDGQVIPASAYDWRRGDILVYGEAA